MKLNNNGQERTAAEHEALLNRAGLHLSRLVPTQGTFSILEARPNSD